MCRYNAKMTFIRMMILIVVICTRRTVDCVCKTRITTSQSVMTTQQVHTTNTTIILKNLFISPDHIQISNDVKPNQSQSQYSIRQDTTKAQSVTYDTKFSFGNSASKRWNLLTNLFKNSMAITFYLFSYVKC